VAGGAQQRRAFAAWMAAHSADMAAAAVRPCQVCMVVCARACLVRVCGWVHMQRHPAAVQQHEPPPPPTHPHTLLPASYVLRACGAAGRWHRPGPLCHAGAEGAHVPQVSACARVWVYLRPPTCCSTCVCE
jgi:hypothetical protein